MCQELRLQSIVQFTRTNSNGVFEGVGLGLDWAQKPKVTIGIEAALIAIR